MGGVSRADDLGDEGGVTAPQGFIRYEKNLLTANISGMSLSAVLMEVGNQSGAVVTLDGFTDRTTSDRFADLPIEDALRRLLPNENFTVIYGKERAADGRVVGARLKELHVYGPGGPRVSNAARVASAPSDQGDGSGDEDATLMQDFTKFLRRHQAVEIEEGSELAAALNASRLPLTTLMREAMQNDNPDVRADAAEVVAEVFDSDPEAPGLVGGHGAAGNEKIDKIAKAVHASGGANAEEFLRNIGRNLKTPALRLKANQILARVRRM